MFDVDVRGQGDEDLVLLYGTPVVTESLEPIPEEFGDDYRVVIPKTAGIGIGPEEALGRLEETLADVGVENLRVLGHSLGAYRALQLALSDSFEVDRIALIGPLTALPDERQVQYDELADGLEAGELDLVETALEFWFRPEYVDQHPEICEEVERWFDEIGDEALAAALRNEMQMPDLLPRLDDITTPTCILVGDCDVGTPPEWSEEIAETLPDSRLHIIQNSGHFPHFERPEVTVKILRGFLMN